MALTHGYAMDLFMAGADFPSAYGAAMRTAFNGFGQGEAVEVSDEPMASLYDGSRQRPARDNVVSLR